MRHPDDTAIGGYFAHEPHSASTQPPFMPEARRYQSARAAITAALQASGRRRAWVPHFICNVVLDALARAGVDALRYPLDPEFAPPADLPVGEQDWVICVDYFGLSAAACDLAILRYGSDRIMVDASQAAFHAARPGVATIYSPRKFVGLPDGGLLVAPFPIAAPPAADEATSHRRSRHLQSRAEGLVAKGYSQFKEAEDSLQDCSPCGMSAYTAKGLDSIAWAEVGARRRANYKTLAQALARSGWEAMPLPHNAVPMCCPATGGSPDPIRERLAREGIFCPIYWPDVSPPGDDPIARALRDDTLYLPCDQRYGEADMLKVAKALERHGGNA